MVNEELHLLIESVALKPIGGLSGSKGSLFSSTTVISYCGNKFTGLGLEAERKVRPLKYLQQQEYTVEVRVC